MRNGDYNRNDTFVAIYEGVIPIIHSANFLVIRIA